jgi:hypothetical protein
MNVSLTKIPCLAKRIAGIKEEFHQKYKKDPTQLRIRYVHLAPANPCEDLKTRKVKLILFVGDSFVRMAYQAMGNWLSNNYRNASVQPSASPFVVNKRCLQQQQKAKTEAEKTAIPVYSIKALPEVCDFEGAFMDGICRKDFTLPHMKVCLGAVELVFRESMFPSARPLPHDFEQFDVVVWGVGNHPSDSENGNFLSINNATAYNDDILETTCNCAPPPHFGEHATKVLPQLFEAWGKGDCVGNCRLKNGGGKGGADGRRVCLKPSGDGSGANAEAPCYDYAADGCTPWSSSIKSKVIWLQPHYRPAAGSHVQEQRPATDLFALEMPAFVKHTCGVQHFVNPYDMTKALVIYIDKLIRQIDPTLILVQPASCRGPGSLNSKVADLDYLTKCLGMHSGR